MTDRPKRPPRPDRPAGRAQREPRANDQRAECAAGGYEQQPPTPRAMAGCRLSDSQELAGGLAKMARREPVDAATDLALAFAWKRKGPIGPRRRARRFRIHRDGTPARGARRDRSLAMMGHAAADRRAPAPVCRAATIA